MYAGRVVAANSTTIEGSILGTAVEPGFGTAIGAALGVGADWVINKIDEKLSREDFISENRKALDLTKTTWREKVTGSLSKAISVWYADTRQVVAMKL